MANVSVIVPVYNVEKYIARCLDSLVNQTIKNLEIIVVNDGSTDKSDEIIKQYQNKYSNIIYVTKENGGLSDARNYGMKYATGEYVAFLDSDDFLNNTMYEKMYEKALSTNCDYVECDFYWSFPKENNLDATSNNIADYENRIDERIEYKDKNEMFIYSRVVAWNKLIKREIIKNEFPKGLYYEDIEFFYKLLPDIKSTEYVKEPLIYYVQRQGSIVNKQSDKTKQIFNVLDNVIKYYRDNNIYEEYRDELEYTYTRLLLCSSLKRIAKIENKEIRNKLLNETWENLNIKFPNWKSNKILNNKKENRFSKKNLYMRSINKITFKIYSNLLGL